MSMMTAASSTQRPVPFRGQAVISTAHAIPDPDLTRVHVLPLPAAASLTARTAAFTQLGKTNSGMTRDETKTNGAFLDLLVLLLLDPTDPTSLRLPIRSSRAVVDSRPHAVTLMTNSAAVARSPSGAGLNLGRVAVAADTFISASIRNITNPDAPPLLPLMPLPHATVPHAAPTVAMVTPPGSDSDDLPLISIRTAAPEIPSTRHITDPSMASAPVAVTHHHAHQITTASKLLIPQRTLMHINMIHVRAPAPASVVGACSAGALAWPDRWRAP